MKLGVVSEYEFVINDPQGGMWEIYSFTLSPDTLTFSKLQDSAFASPARYLQEIFDRLCMLESPGQETAKFVFNPLFETNRLIILLVLGALRKTVLYPGIVVLNDSNGSPVGYFLPAWLKRGDSRFLTLLSTVNGKTDTEWLSLAFFNEAQCVRVSYLDLSRAGHNGFNYNEVSAGCKWAASRAIGILNSKISHAPAVGVDLIEASKFRDTILFAAIMPHHAGDVLFFTLAFNNINTHISRIVVNKAYVDIVSDNTLWLMPMPIDKPLINRDENFLRGNVMPDHVYFETFRDALPEDCFYYYCRPSRNYNVTEFHLIDHFAFALGRSSCSNANLLFNNKPSPELFKPDIPVYPIRVLLHFDGGWPLKVYPKESQERLIDLLHAKGYVITVLASAEYEHPKCDVTTFRSYSKFTDMVKMHHILIGMDSFPCHYSAHVLGLPTICLFSSTKPANSNAPRAVNYVYLEEGLSCRPCYAVAKCPVYRKTYCKNFVSPHVVAEEIIKMLREVGGEQPEPQETSVHSCADESCVLTVQAEGRVNAKRIDMTHLDMKVFLAGMLLPCFRYSSRLYLEFVAAIKREGILSATRRAIRFVIRKYRGVS